MIRSANLAVAGPSRLTSSAARTLSPSSAPAHSRPRSTSPSPTSWARSASSLDKGKFREVQCSGFSSPLQDSAQRQQYRLHHSYIRTIAPCGGQARIPLKSTRNGVFGLATSRGTRAYQEDTASVSCLNLPSKELQRNYLKFHSSSSTASNRAAAQAALEWDPDKAGGEELAGQVVWFGCFDGHGGQQVSSFLRDNLHKTFEGVEKDMVTDTVQYTRELGGYFRRFNGGLLERWVRKEHLKPVRAGPAAGRKAPAKKKESAIALSESISATSQEESAEVSVQEGKGKGVEHLSNPETLSHMLNHNRDAANEAAKPSDRTINKPVRRDGAVQVGGKPEEVGQAGSAGSSSVSDWKLMIERIPPPEGMENDTLTMAERLTLAWLIADRVIQSSPDLDVGGSTASVALLHALDIPSVPWYSSSYVGVHIAHVGDTRVLLCASKDGKAMPLTTYHHPDDRAESERLRKMGAGMITDSFGEARWMGALANTRSFGDSRFKKVGITAEPEIFSQVIKGEDYSFLIAFSDGVGGVMSDQEVVDLCRDTRHPSQAAQKVLTFAEELGAQDNCTVIVIPLKGWGKVGGQDMTKERRELRRSKIDLYRDNRQ